MRRFKPFDWFMVINTAALVASTLSTYYTAEFEFGLYAAVILAAGVVAWRWLRRVDYPLWLLLLVEVGIISHFAGGYVKYGDEGWLYWHHFAGIRYDQIVHFYNSMVGALAFATIFEQVGLKLGAWRPFVVVTVVLGLGAVIEIVEFFAVLTIPNVGVGDYANNMMDLVMNLLGGITGVLLAAAGKRFSARALERREAATRPA